MLKTMGAIAIVAVMFATLVGLGLGGVVGGVEGLEKVPYSAVPDILELRQVVVVHRHGDRAQFTPALGTAYPEQPVVRDKWFQALPVEETRKVMRIAAVTAADQKADSPDDYSLHSSLYSGFDRNIFPYGQLTELGAQQLFSLGRRLRSRYLAPLRGLHADNMRLRSSNLCRTIQSARCLIAGMLDLHASNDSTDARAFIHVIEHREHENLFPQETLCPALRGRRLKTQATLHEVLPFYSNLSTKVETLLGEAVPWMNIFETLHCHATHGIAVIEGFSPEDVEAMREVVLHLWRAWGEQPHLNRLVIGRFVADVLRDLDAHHATPLLIYSGHDITLVPLLFALQAFDGSFPPYASHLALEIAQHRTDGQLWVRIVYNDEVLVLPTASGSLPGADEWQPWQQVRARLEETAITQATYVEHCEYNDEL